MSKNHSDSKINEIRKRLKIFMEENPSVSNRIIATNIGYSPGYVSQFCNNKFPTPSKELEFAERVESYLDNEEEALAQAVSSGHLKFAMTAAAQDIFKTAAYASTEHKVGVIVGVPGCGKTISVTEYQKRNPNNVLIEISPVVTQRSLLQDICLGLKIPIHYVRKDRQTLIPGSVLFKEIIDQLTGTRRNLIFDEGENLITSCLEIIRRIHDFTRVGIVLSGTDKLLDRLRGPRRELQQLYSRVGVWKKIDLLKTGDAKAILQINYPDGLKFAANFLQLSKNNGRILEHLIDLVKKTIHETGEELNEDLIDEAASSLLT